MIGEKIQAIAKEKRIPASEIADMMNITVQHLYKLFKKESIESRYIFQFAEILNVPADVLLVGEKADNLSATVTNELKNEIKRLKERIAELEEQLEDKNQIIAYARNENLFAYANLITALMQNRAGAGGEIPADVLSDITRSKIFDESFLRKLLDQGLITEADFLFFVQSKPKKKE